MGKEQDEVGGPRAKRGNMATTEGRASGTGTAALVAVGMWPRLVRYTVMTERERSRSAC